ncbi:sensor histidine kinase [Quadrisphaera sp. DSM 44207]|uniref:sensor histidine kinase n=1 Tax=Quadrisphaera sp. DSM 44207 TaxID=1881057 RepID=UPI00088D87A5|nr:histidine kinase [Quadrisphaera sp. DSM 44207]SDQ07566.1 Signal transduction histidine kinase [Quadrisphaera sp. DSM 44207]
MERDTERQSPVPERIYAGVALAAAVLGLLEGPRTPLVLGCVLLSLVPSALVAAGRDLPLGAFALLSIAPVVLLVAVHGVGGAVFLATVAASRVASRAGPGALVGATTAAVVALPFLPFLLPAGARDAGSVYFAFGDLLGVLVGLLVHRATALAEDLRAADARLAEAAAREERHRIARDVHDLVAHSLTVVVLHVGGARRVLRTDPAAAEGALADAERVCRESLDGIRGVVGLLRDEREERPVLSLDLQELADGYRAAGLPVALRTSGALEALPLVTRVTLHRVVQEALANAARHADPPSAAVDVAVEGSGVLVRVSNPVREGAGAAASSGGYGLVGLAERVASVGGDLAGGPDGGAWVVRCRLPLPGASTRPSRAASAASAAGTAGTGRTA